ncbi:DEAD/DEAH box helicase family protein [Endozoicomonas acroporae]|uniref:DEAD/DEAH box helicase family protein n=1 Tax=Endozoicomonas acroporae TaxID=1701104 RepID=UPI003D78FE05
MEATPLYPHTPPHVKTPDDNGSVFLTTSGINDPLLPKLIDAINRAREIAITVAFIRVSGLKLLFGALSDAVERGATLKVLTSGYMDVTDPQALRELMLLRERNADIRIYQSDGQQSFHMKSYIFVHMDNRQWLEGSAFVGSSNIQIEALQALYNSRLAGYQRGLVVLATGLGKTWLAAFDTQQFKAKRILFVTHREEILLQAQKAFTWSLNATLLSESIAACSHRFTIMASKTSMLITTRSPGAAANFP